MTIEQAIYGGQGGGGYRFLARSPGFADDWLADAERLCTGFGERPASASCPEALFVRPMGKARIAVVQVADQGRDDAGRPGALAFRLLVLPTRLYRELGSDPFRIADTFPPSWHARGDLPTLGWAVGAPSKRTVAQLRHVLDQPTGPTLLGGAQALLDGGRLVLERNEPAPQLVRDLWSLLPSEERGRLWPATFCFSNAHRFHVAVTPRASGPEFAGYLPEDQAGDYPEGRYELALQTAVESGNQQELDGLLARRSRAEAMRLALGLLIVTVIVAVVTGVSVPGPAPVPTPTSRARVERPNLPSPEQCPRLSADERRQLTGRVSDLGRRLGVELPAGTDDAELNQALDLLDKRLGAPDPRRAAGPLANLGAFQRQVRGLLWKHHVAGYDDLRLKTPELIDRLRDQLIRQGTIKEDRGG